jgi:hypothetical protein
MDTSVRDDERDRGLKVLFESPQTSQAFQELHLSNVFAENSRIHCDFQAS